MMDDFLHRAELFLSANATKTSISITEYFICGWLMLTGVQSIVGWFFQGHYVAELEHPQVLLFAGIFFVVTGVLFLVVKIRNVIRWHSYALLFVYCLFNFAFIVEVCILPEAVGLWIGALLLTILTGLFYLRLKLLNLRGKDV